MPKPTDRAHPGRAPQDHKSPARLDAEGGPVEVQYNDRVYTLPGSLDDAEGAVLEAIDNEKLSHALRGLLSQKDYADFQRLGGVGSDGEPGPAKVKDFSGLFDAYARAIGLGTTGD